MNMLHALRCDFSKMLRGRGFWACVGITALVCFTSITQYDSTGRSFSVIDVLLDPGIERLSWFDTMTMSCGNMTVMFLPILSALPFVSMFCSERESGLLRLSVSRAGKLPYALSKAISAVVSAGLGIMFGYLLYGCAILPFFAWDRGFSGLWDAFVLLVGMFALGGFSVLPAMFLSSFVKNKYLICCFPFILSNFLYIGISRLSTSLMRTENYALMSIVDNLRPDYVRFAVAGYLEDPLFSILYYPGVTLLACAGFMLIFGRRFDLGE